MFRYGIACAIGTAVLLIGQALPDDLSLPKTLTELTAFGLLGWTWYYFIRHGLPRIIEQFRQESREQREHAERQVALLLEELQAERADNRECQRQTEATLRELMINCRKNEGPNHG